MRPVFSYQFVYRELPGFWAERCQHGIFAWYYFTQAGDKAIYLEQIENAYCQVAANLVGITWSNTTACGANTVA
jgi:hypothetical protein